MKRHPITKLSWAVQRRVSGEPDSIDCFGIERDIARHVKPLLDALEEVLRKFSISGDHEFCDEACEVKMAGRLLAEWRRPL